MQVDVFNYIFIHFLYKITFFIQEKSFFNIYDKLKLIVVESIVKDIMSLK